MSAEWPTSAQDSIQQEKPHGRLTKPREDGVNGRGGRWRGLHTDGRRRLVSVTGRADCVAWRADGDYPLGAAGRIRIAAWRREVPPPAEGCRAARQTAGICDLREPIAPGWPRQFLRSTGRAMRRFPCADWLRDSSARAQRIRAKDSTPRADNSIAALCGGWPC